MTDTSAEELLAQLGRLQEAQSLALHRLAESFTDNSTGSSITKQKRSSDASASDHESSNPASLQADLEHYRVCTRHKAFALRHVTAAILNYECNPAPAFLAG